MFFENFRIMSHKLSGVAVVVNNRILLVHPKKFRKYDNKWSIPKGHVEHRNPLVSALKELREETGIKLGRDYDDFVDLEYKKSGFNKKLDVYIYYLKKEDVEKFLDKGWKIKKDIYDKREILKSQFIDLDTAYDKIEPFMYNLIDYIKSKKSL